MSTRRRPAAPGEDPRVTRSKAKILEATLDELPARGFEGLTIEGVAERAGVGKSTIYRHWDTKPALIADAMETLRPTVRVPDRGDLREDLVAITRTLVEMLTTSRAATLVPLIIEAAERDAEMAALHHDFVQARRQPLRDVLQAAIARDELPHDLDLEVATDLLTGPLFFRRFISREPVTPALAERIVDTLLPQLPTVCHRGHTRPRGRRHARRR